MADCNSISTPMECKPIAAENYNFKFPYRELIGSLIYLAILTPPDISYAVGVLSRSLENPTTEHINTAKRVLRYLKGTINYGLLYRLVSRFSIKSVFRL